jgi:hypothetical protein
VKVDLEFLRAGRVEMQLDADRFLMWRKNWTPELRMLA